MNFKTLKIYTCFNVISIEIYFFSRIMIFEHKNFECIYFLDTFKISNAFFVSAFVGGDDGQ